MSQTIVDALLDYQNEQKELIDQLKRQLSAAKGQITKLKKKETK